MKWETLRNLGTFIPDFSVPLCDRSRRTRTKTRSTQAGSGLRNCRAEACEVVGLTEGSGTMEVRTNTGKFLGNYRRRIVDDEMDYLLAELPALLLDGPKAVGKTETARQRAKTFVLLNRE